MVNEASHQFKLGQALPSPDAQAMTRLEGQVKVMLGKAKQVLTSQQPCHEEARQGQIRQDQARVSFPPIIKSCQESQEKTTQYKYQFKKKTHKTSDCVSQLIPQLGLSVRSPNMAHQYGLSYLQHVVFGKPVFFMMAWGISGYKAEVCLLCHLIYSWKSQSFFNTDAIGHGPAHIQ